MKKKYIYKDLHVGEFRFLQELNNPFKHDGHESYILYNCIQPKILKISVNHILLLFCITHVTLLWKTAAE